MLISELLSMINFMLNDASNITYPEASLISAINHGCRMTALVRPDVSSVIEQVTLAEGVRQILPDGRLRLMDACYLLDDSDVPVSPIEMVLRSDLDRLDPGWIAQSASSEVTEVMVDERTPRVFWVNPPAVSGTRIQLSMATMPDTIMGKDDEFPLTDKYVPPVMEWVLYLMFSRDSQNPTNLQRSIDHRSQFYQQLQVKTQAEMAVSPSSPQETM